MQHATHSDSRVKYLVDVLEIHQFPILLEQHPHASTPQHDASQHEH